MASLKASPTIPILFLSNRYSKESPLKTQLNAQKPWLNSQYECRNGGRRRRVLACCCVSSTGEVGSVGVGDAGKCEVGSGKDGFLVSGFGWGVRRMVEVGEEMRRVAYVQAEAFHVPVALFNDFFFEFFKAEVLAALMYRLRNSPPDRYACLVAESVNEPNSLRAQELVGVVDITVQREEDVVRHLEGVEEYVYVSGIAVLSKFRRRRIATVLLKACDAMSQQWDFDYLALRAYEEDSAARKLYTNAGYELVSEDPSWVTWIGRKRRVLMIKRTSNLQC